MCDWRQDEWPGLTAALRAPPVCVSLGNFGEPAPRCWTLPLWFQVLSPVLHIDGGCGAGLDIEVRVKEREIKENVSGLTLDSGNFWGTCWSTHH